MPEDEEFTEFVRANSRALLRTAFRLTGDRGLAEDLLQTALTTTYLRWSRIEPAAAYAYTRRVLVNTATSWWRRLSWRGERPRGDVPDLVVEVITDALDDRATVIAAVRDPEFSDYITARNPTPDDSHTLNIPPGVPMLVTRRLATHNGRPLIMQETRRSAEDTQLLYNPSPYPYSLLPRIAMDDMRDV